MTCKKCKHSKWSHWSGGVIGKCTLQDCNCEEYRGNINRVNMTIRRQLEEKYGVIRKIKNKENIEDSP